MFETDDRVCVMLRTKADRLTLDTFAALFSDYPWVSRAPLDCMVGALARQVLEGQAPAVLGAFVAATHEMAAQAPTVSERLGRHRAGSASRDQILLLALVEAGQKGDTGRAIEAAIALLDTGCVHRVVAAAKSVGVKLAQNGLILSHISDALFAIVVGYAAIPTVADMPGPQVHRGPPTLRVFHTA